MVVLCRAASRPQGSLLETWLLMEYADRGSLSDALRSGRFPTHDFTAIYKCLLDIASGGCCAPCTGCICTAGI
jgi:hypothetical protein